MKKCRFLEIRRSREGGPAYYCGVGVNFFSVEENRRLCRTCPLNDLSDVPLCEHLEVYTFLKRNSERQGLVRIEFHCDLLHEPLDDPNVCTTCLHYQAKRVCEDRVPWPPVFQAGNR